MVYLSLPNLKMGGSFHGKLLNNQRVIIYQAKGILPLRHHLKEIMPIRHTPWLQDLYHGII
jgi:hypothetical protein